MNKSNPNLKTGREKRYVTKSNADQERPISWLPIGHTFAEKLERIEMLYEQVQVYRIWVMARQTVPQEERTFFDEEIERLAAFLKAAI